MFCNACSLRICLQIHIFFHLVFTVDKSLKLLNILHNPIQLNAKQRVVKHWINLIHNASTISCNSILKMTYEEVENHDKPES